MSRAATAHLARASVVLALLAAAAAPSQAAGQSRIVRDTVHSGALECNLLGDSATREVLVYLPPSYQRDPDRRFPVLYLLHGFTSLPSEWLDGSYPGLSLQTVMDSLIGEDSLPDFLVVMPDASSRLGGGFYTNSPVTGGWADFIVRDLVEHVDRQYRTEPDRAHRALAGHSMGGFGALALGFQYPERFGLLYAMSPCCIAFEGEFSPASEAWAAAAKAPSWQVPRTPAGVRLVVALAAALSPAPHRPRLYGELPFEPDKAGRLRARPETLRRWRSRMPIGLVPGLTASATPQPEIHLEFGLQDRLPSVGAGVRALARTLDSAGVRHSVSPFEGGHVDRMPERVSGYLLPTVGRWFRSGPP